MLHRRDGGRRPRAGRGRAPEPGAGVVHRHADQRRPGQEVPGAHHRRPLPGDARHPGGGGALGGRHALPGDRRSDDPDVHAQRPGRRGGDPQRSGRRRGPALPVPAQRPGDGLRAAAGDQLELVPADPAVGEVPRPRGPRVRRPGVDLRGRWRGRDLAVAPGRHGQGHHRRLPRRRRRRRRRGGLGRGELGRAPDLGGRAELERPGAVGSLRRAGGLRQRGRRLLPARDPVAGGRRPRHPDHDHRGPGSRRAVRWRPGRRRPGGERPGLQGLGRPGEGRVHAARAQGPGLRPGGAVRGRGQAGQVPAQRPEQGRHPAGPGDLELVLPGADRGLGARPRRAALGRRRRRHLPRRRRGRDEPVDPGGHRRRRHLGLGRSRRRRRRRRRLE